MGNAFLDKRELVLEKQTQKMLAILMSLEIIGNKLSERTMERNLGPGYIWPFVQGVHTWPLEQWGSNGVRVDVKKYGS